MSRNKRALLMALLLLIPLGAHAASDRLIAPEDIREEKVNYETTVVEAGVYARTASASAKEFYPLKYNLNLGKSGAKFMKFLVRKGDEVKAGDVLATFQVEEDTVALATQRKKLERARKDLEAGKETRLQALKEIEISRQKAQDPFEREQLSLRLAYQQLSLEKYIYQQENSILDMQKKLEEMEEESRACQLIAPADGIITSLKSKREGDQVSSGEVLVQMYSTEGMLLQIDNANGFFRYGMDVNVEVGRAKERTVIPGKVVGVDTLLPKSRRTNKAYILLGEYDRENVKLLNPSVVGETCRIENVIAIPRSLITMEAGKHYVLKLEEGVVHKRFVQYYNSVINPNQAWIVQGLEDGEVIIAD